MRRGFTLLEMVFVVTTIGIVAAIALPRFAGVSDRRRVAGAGERLAADVAMIRERARVTSGTARMRFSRAGYGWAVTAGGQQVARGETVLEDAPYSVTIRSLTAGTDDEVLFDGYGKIDVKLQVVLGAGGYRRTYTLATTNETATLGEVRLPALGED